MIDCFNQSPIGWSQIHIINLGIIQIESQLPWFIYSSSVIWCLTYFKIYLVSMFVEIFHYGMQTPPHSTCTQIWTRISHYCCKCIGFLPIDNSHSSKLITFVNFHTARIIQDRFTLRIFMYQSKRQSTLFLTHHYHRKRYTIFSIKETQICSDRDTRRDVPLFLKITFIPNCRNKIFIISQEIFRCKLQTERGRETFCIGIITQIHNFHFPA